MYFEGWALFFRYGEAIRSRDSCHLKDSDTDNQKVEACGSLAGLPQKAAAPVPGRGGSKRA